MSMKPTYTHLGLYSDLVTAAQQGTSLYPIARPGPATQSLVRQALGFCNGPEIPQAVQIESSWERGGLQGQEISWWVGYGPRTHAYVLKPAGSKGPLPGVVALHDHGGFKYYGKEKIAWGMEEPPPVLQDWWQSAYGGRPYANSLASEGLVVLVPDTFLWGSRKFSSEVFPPMLRQLADLEAAAWPAPPVTPADIQAYNLAARDHEHLVAKYCNLLGTSLAGIVSHEDRIAVNYLLSRSDVVSGGVGCLGLSGGGNRAALLQATHPAVCASVIVGMMCTYAGLLDHNVFSHTWMFFPYLWARYGDWPDLAACRAPSPLLVQYDLDDELFTVEGMQSAHARLVDHYHFAGAPEAYRGEFYPGPHKFDLPMQAAAFDWLKYQLSTDGGLHQSR
jgi:dienelactone hydrolase